MDVRLSQRAIEQYCAILIRSHQDFGEQTASRYADLLDGALQPLSDTAELARAVSHDELCPGLRSIHLRSIRSAVKRPRHIIVFRVANTVVDVVAILHERMDIAARLREFGEQKASIALAGCVLLAFRARSAPAKPSARQATKQDMLSMSDRVSVSGQARMDVLHSGTRRRNVVPSRRTTQRLLRGC